jgi:hypothetical protein
MRRNNVFSLGNLGAKDMVNFAATLRSKPLETPIQWMARPGW